MCTLVNLLVRWSRGGAPSLDTEGPCREVCFVNNELVYCVLLCIVYCVLLCIVYRV